MICTVGRMSGQCFVDLTEVGSCSSYNCGVSELVNKRVRELVNKRVRE